MKTHNFCALISTAFLAACSVAPNSQLTYKSHQRLNRCRQH